MSETKTIFYTAYASDFFYKNKCKNIIKNYIYESDKKIINEIPDDYSQTDTLTADGKEIVKIVPLP